VADREPPRFAGDERETLLDYQRSSLFRKVADLGTAARRELVPSGTSPRTPLSRRAVIRERSTQHRHRLA
jgi:hypothetical protein